MGRTSRDRWDCSPICSEKHRWMMWASIWIYVLEIIIPQAKGQENSTQMYYAKLTLDRNALGNLTEILKPFVTNTTLHVGRPEKTTTCQNVSTGSNCTCEPGHRWSDKVCKSMKCCRNDKCTFPQNPPSMCIAENTVSVIGSITLKEDQYFGCLADKSSEHFKKCNERLLEEMKTVYSTLSRFDFLTISEYRAGSVRADFEVRIAGSIKARDLIAKTENLSTAVTASLVLETAGIPPRPASWELGPTRNDYFHILRWQHSGYPNGLVRLQLPSSPVCHDDQPVLTCTEQEDLDTEPAWQLSRDGQVFDITNGTESEVTFQKLQSTVRIRSLSKIWTGVYACVYTSRSGEGQIIISHKASGEMDISLRPNINITASPMFPRCQKSSDTLLVKVRCEIESSNKSDNVTWISPDAKLTEMPSTSSEGKEVHVAIMTVSCDTPTALVTCILRNRCDQENATTAINIISENDQFCEAEGDWEVTKAGYTAVLKCENSAGQRRRTCQSGSSTGTWDSEASACVNKELDSVLQKANIANTGLGSLQNNAAHVFSLLKAVTNDSQTIKTSSNLNASVHVLFTLCKKGQLHPNESTADDLLASSSNLLEEYLEGSWEETRDEDNWSLAERYLSSVEELIQTSNMTGAPKKKNVEVAEQYCSVGSQCSNTVFNVTVRIEGDDPGSVKTTGFQQLENYLPNNNSEFKPNSIVVSTTTERKQSDSVKVKIDFQLLKPRPRNVELRCVAWDNKSRGWSPRGCKWVGPSNEAHCICRHLSSFAILMSRYPLDVPWISEITYVGLSVSVASLVVSLLIELTLWRAVTKTKSLQLRHTAHVNISLCLLVADCCFLASSKPHDLSPIWCKTLVVLKHFCYLSMFFWMLCLSGMLLHQTIFLFHNVSMKVYLRLSLVLGYVCPSLIVAITVVASQGGAEGNYFSADTCWLVYTGLMKGSIHAFVVPVGIIVFVNVFSMLVVIMKLLDHPMNMESSYKKEKKAAITVMRSVILLTPVFGLTWAFGFAVMLLDLTSGALAYTVHYIFTLLNAFQGLLILFTASLGDKLTRQALLNRLKKGAGGSSSEGSTTLEYLEEGLQLP